MSLQNLVEMEEMGGGAVPMPKPRPIPRQVPRRGGAFLGGSGDEEGDGNDDKVMSISSPEIEGAGGGGGKRVAFTRSATNSFDNDAFVEDDDNSSATFTIENEKGGGGGERGRGKAEPSVKVTKKPPVAKVRRREEEEKVGGMKGGKEDYLAVDMEPQEEEGGDEVEKGGGGGVKESEPEVDSDNDKGSVTDGSLKSLSGTAAASKLSVKSRFGKLFKVSGKKKSNYGDVNVIGGGEGGDEVTTGGEGGGGSSEGVSEKGRKASLFGGRWKKTFSRSTSKPVPEEEEDDREEDKEVDEEKAKPEVKRKREKFSRKGRRKEDTRIFIPDEEEDKGKKKEEPEVEEETTEEEEDQGYLKVEQGKKTPPLKRSPKFKPLAKLVIRKGKKKEMSPPQPPSPPPKQDKRFTSGSGSSGDSGEGEGGFEGDALTTSANEDEGKLQKRKQRRKTTAQPEVVTDSVSGKDLLFGVTIHCSDLLPLDPNVIHPVVKVTVMYQNGKWMRKGGGGGGDAQMSPSNTGGGRSSKLKVRRRRREGEDEEDKVEEDNSGDKITTSSIGKAVLPIMTQPCQARHSIPTFAPTWNELLVFEEPFKRFTKKTGSQESSEKQPIVFFEIMDFLPMELNGNRSQTGSGTFHGSDPGWYKICWGFLKPIGANGYLNLNRKLRLQLYKPVKLKRPSKETAYHQPEVYLWWKEKKIREKVACTLWVTPKGIIPPEMKSASLRQLLSMRKEQLTQAILDSQLAPKRGRRRGSSSNRDSYEDYSQEAPIWSRISGQSCKPPNKLVASLPSSQIETLNITISGNVHCLKFSPCGNYLAAALDTDDLHVVLIFGVPGWKLLKTLKGHHGLVYEVAWNILEDEKQNFCRHFLASASSDATVRIWKMEDGRVKTLKLFKVLYHPSYVYSARWHPWSNYPMLSSSILATACFDWVIRIWLIQPEVEEEQVGKKKKRDTPSKLIRSQSHQSHYDVSPIILLDKHNSFVNCLLFDAEGGHMFSGDGTGCLLKWSCGAGSGGRPPLKKNMWRLEKDVKLHSASIPINSLALHPSGSRLLVHLRDNLLKILDVVTLIPLQSFPGLDNGSLQISSCFSPCGNLVLSGSEDGTLLIWDADTGKILQIAPQPPNSPSSKQCYVACVDYHPFDFYVGVGLASKMISEPSPVLIHFYEGPGQSKKSGSGNFMNYPILKKTALKFRQSIEKEEGMEESFLHHQRHPPTKRVDSSEKFMAIIKKLDTALYFAQQRNKKRRSEATTGNCMEGNGVEGDGGKGEDKPPRKYVQKINKKEEGSKARRRPQSASQILEGSSSRSPSLPPRARGRREYSSGTKSDSEEQRSYQLGSSVEKDKQEKLLDVLPPKPLKRRSVTKLI